MRSAQRRDEAVVDALGDDQARRGGAALAGGVEGALHGALDRDVEVGVVEHHQRVLAAHLELELAPCAAIARLRDALAGRLTEPGEGDRVDARVVEEGLPDDASRGPSRG